MKKLLAITAIVTLLLPALAEARDRRPDSGMRMQAQGQQAKKGPGPMRRGESDKRGEHDKRHQNKLTDEERRGLHRDLDRANREIYRR